MSAITIQAITILENKEDDTLMAKEEFFKMIDEARASKKNKGFKTRTYKYALQIILSAYGHYEDK